MSYAHKNQILPVRNVLIPVTHDTHLFNFDYHAMSGRGLEPEEGSVYTLRPDGRFGGAIAIEEATENIVPNGFTFEGWSIDSHQENTCDIEVVDIDGTPTLHLYNIQKPTNPEYPRITGPAFANTITGEITSSFYAWSNNEGARLRLLMYGEPGNTTRWSHHKYLTTYKQRHTMTNISEYNLHRAFFVADEGNEYWIQMVQVEQKPFPTSFTEGSRPNGSIHYRPGISPVEGTIMMWWNPQLLEDPRATGQQSNPQIFHIGKYNNESSITIWARNRNISWYIRTSGSGWDIAQTAIGGNFLQDNTWYHIALTWENSNTFKIYLNGELGREGVATNPIGQWGGDQEFRIYYSAASHPNALYDEIAILPYAISPEEIMAIYESQAPLYDPYDLSAIIG